MIVFVIVAVFLLLAAAFDKNLKLGPWGDIE